MGLGMSRGAGDLFVYRLQGRTGMELGFFRDKDARVLKRKRESEDFQRPVYGNRAGERVGESLVALVGSALGWS